MEPDPAVEYLIDDAGWASDGELPCGISPASGADPTIAYADACSLEQANTRKAGLAYGEACSHKQANNRMGVNVGYGRACSLEPTQMRNSMGMGVIYGQACGLEQTNGRNNVDWAMSCIDTCRLEQGNTTSRKRTMDEESLRPKSKACREKMRRDKLNDRFVELSSVLEPGRPPKSDKASILSDAARVLEQLKAEAQELRVTNDKLQETITDLKAEKNELRDEKTRLKADKERLEQQVKAMSMAPAGFMPPLMAFHPGAMAAAFAPHGQAPAKKPAAASAPAPAPFPACAGVPMWQWLPPAVVDTTQDAKLWSPNA